MNGKTSPANLQLIAEAEQAWSLCLKQAEEEGYAPLPQKAGFVLGYMCGRLDYEGRVN